MVLKYFLQCIFYADIKFKVTIDITVLLVNMQVNMQDRYTFLAHMSIGVTWVFWNMISNNIITP